MLLNIESDISDQDLLILFLEDEIAANSRPYPRNELSELKRLGNVIVGTRIQSLDLTVFAALHRQNNDGKKRRTFTH